jgi:hypothetical protein
MKRKVAEGKKQLKITCPKAVAKTQHIAADNFITEDFRYTSDRRLYMMKMQLTNRYYYFPGPFTILREGGHLKTCTDCILKQWKTQSGHGKITLIQNAS